MDLDIKFIILFVQDLETVAAFYSGILGLNIKNREEGWVEFNAGACTLALHSGGAPVQARRPPKIAFGATDVSTARTALIERGAKLGPVKTFGGLQFCEGKDPEGNIFQLSNRK